VLALTTTQKRLLAVILNEFESRDSANLQLPAGWPAKDIDGSFFPFGDTDGLGDDGAIVAGNQRACLTRIAGQCMRRT
jgi:hypothetical protein